MRGLNRVELIGHLGQDPELRTTASGTQVASVSIAVSESWKDRAGEYQEKTLWVKLTFWDKLAGIAHSYLKKGSMIFVDGALKVEEWEDKADGSKRTGISVTVSKMLMLDKRAGNDSQPQELTVDVQYGADDADDELPFSLAFLIPATAAAMGLSGFML